jgi:hypothetical protein
MRTWQMEYYYSFPNVRVRFTVQAETFDEAVAQGAKIISGMRRTATYALGE